MAGTQGDHYAKGWEAGVLWARHTLVTEKTVEGALLAIDAEMRRAVRVREAASRNTRARIDP